MVRRLLALVVHLFGIGGPRSGVGDRHHPVHLRPTKWKPASPRAASSSISLSAPCPGVQLNPARVSLDSAAVLLNAAVGAGTGYSQASYYTSLGLFVLSVPGLWSPIKRLVKSKRTDSEKCEHWLGSKEDDPKWEHDRYRVVHKIRGNPVMSAMLSERPMQSGRFLQIFA